MNGIGDFSSGLANALEQLDTPTDVIALCNSRRPDLERSLSIYAAVILQYNPFMYGHWGVAPWLFPLLQNLRRRSQRPLIGLMIHEPYVPMVNWKWTLMGAWQRAQLAGLRVSADLVIASVQQWADRFALARPCRPTFHLPVSSNLPDMSSCRDQVRNELALGPGTLVLVTFGQPHNSRLLDYVVGAANQVAASGRAVMLLDLGAEKSKLPGLRHDVVLRSFGWLPAEAVARLMAAGDIFLAPLIDGVTSRRTTVMAALQHGVPVVGTRGQLTDAVLRSPSAGLTLVPVRSPQTFADAVTGLANSAPDRARLGEAGRRLFKSDFDWPVLARRTVAILREVGASA